MQLKGWILWHTHPGLNSFLEMHAGSGHLIPWNLQTHWAVAMSTFGQFLLHIFRCFCLAFLFVGCVVFSWHFGWNYHFLNAHLFQTDLTIDHEESLIYSRHSGLYFLFCLSMHWTHYFCHHFLKEKSQYYWLKLIVMHLWKKKF